MTPKQLSERDICSKFITPALHRAGWDPVSQIREEVHFTKGREQLDNFIDPEATYPVLVTTSRLLSTGVDVQTCRLIVAHASSVSPK